MKSRFILVAFIVFLLPLSQGGLLTSKLYASPDEESKLDPKPHRKNGGFGSTVAIQKGWCGVGAPFSGTGIVNLFKRSFDKWPQSHVLTPSDGKKGDCFGSSIAWGYGQNRIVVGASKKDVKDAFGEVYKDTGGVYVFRYSHNKQNWLEKQIIDCPESWRNVAGAGFGYSSASDGSLLVIGAPWASNTPCESHQCCKECGKVYIYRWNKKLGYQNVGSLRPPNHSGKKNERFGFSVAIYDDLIAVGAPGENKVYIYRRIVNTYEFKLVDVFTPKNSQKEDLTGSSVDIYKNTIVVGAPLHNKKGAVYVLKLKNDKVKLKDKVTPEDPDKTANYGSFVKVWSNKLFIGAEGNDDIPGYVEMRRKVGSLPWKVKETYKPENNKKGDHFGASGDIDGKQKVFGAPKKDDGLEDNGAAYIYK